MIYQSRRRKYVSGRDKIRMSRRIFRLALTFGSIAFIGWLFFNRYTVLDWLRTWFY